MSEIVTLVNETPLVSTFNLFKGMGYKEHRKLKEVINSNIDAFNDLGFLPLEKTKPINSSGGRPIESYMLNEDHFILLVILAKNTPESVGLKIRVSKEFKRLKNGSLSLDKRVTSISKKLDSVKEAGKLWSELGREINKDKKLALLESKKLLEDVQLKLDY